MSNKGELFHNELGGWLEIKRLKIVDEEEKQASNFRNPQMLRTILEWISRPELKMMGLS